MRLASQVAIVTGAGRGIGAELARGLAREGAAVIVNYAHSKEAAEEVAADIRSNGGRAVAVRADVGRLEEHEVLIGAAMNEYGRIDILINNAAIDRRAPFLEVTPEQWDAVMDVDLKGPYFLGQRAARVMVPQGGGVILNITSVHDEQAHRNNSIYTVAKGGMKMMTRCQALELAEHGIRVNSLAPGAIYTDINRKVLSDPAYKKRVEDLIPLRRIGTVTELVGAALLLVSSEGSYITGTTLYVDGGLLL